MDLNLKMKLSIFIPIYNEAKTIYLILDKVKVVKLIDNIEKEIIERYIKIMLNYFKRLIKHFKSNRFKGILFSLINLL